MKLNQLFDSTSNLVQANLDRRSVAQGLSARNIANIDTPNFQGSGLEFEKQLKAALDGQVLPTKMARTNPGHLPTGDQGPYDNAPGQVMNIGPVHIDIEMSKIAENNIMFNTMVTILTKKYGLLKHAITEGGGR